MLPFVLFAVLPPQCYCNYGDESFCRGEVAQPSTSSWWVSLKRVPSTSDSCLKQSSIVDVPAKLEDCQGHESYVGISGQVTPISCFRA